MFPGISLLTGLQANASLVGQPDWEAASLLPFVLLGIVVGLMVGLTSIGAGAIATPVLILVLDIPPLVAVGSAIVAGAVTKAVGSWTHHHRKTIDRQLVRYLLMGSAPGVGVAMFLVEWLRHQSIALANVWVDRLLGGGLILLGVCVLARETGWARRLQAHQDHKKIRLRALGVGLAVGLLFGATSIGTGSLLVLLLSIFLSLEEVRIVGTAILYGFGISLLAAALHIVWGTVNWSLVAALLLGTIPGVAIGAQLATRAPRRFLRACFSVAAIWGGLKLI